MTYRENAAVLETYLHNIRNIEEAPPGPMELEALDAAIEVMKAAVENVEYGAFAWDNRDLEQRGRTYCKNHGMYRRKRTCRG